MTREEAIKRIQDFIGWFKKDSDIYEALEMAIQALSQEPCDDAISREVARKALQNEIDKIRPPFDGWVGETMASLRAGVRLSRNIIEDLPSVTQKSETVTEFADRCRECGKMRKGHWIYDETIENWRCSKCNETPKTMGYVGTADFMAEHFKFCNHCGAKMESEE